jgi:type II secretion system protein N
LFAYFLFPSEAVKGYIAFKLNAAAPDLTVDMAVVKPSFPPGLKLTAVHLERNGGGLLDAGKVIIRPDYVSLLGADKVYRFKATLYDGIVEGTLHLGQGSGTNPMEVDAIVQGVKVEQIKLFQTMTGRTVVGTLNGTVHVRRAKGFSLEATADLTLSDGRVALLMPVFTYKDLTFKLIEADLELKDRTLDIMRCSIKGQPADATLNGTIALREPLNKSLLNIEGTVKPQPALLALLRKSLPANLIPQTGTDADGIGIALSGTLESPGFAFR